MARLVLPLLGIFIALLYMRCTTASASKAADFIKTSCKATRYPGICVKSLSAYASAIKRDEHRLALTALSVSLARAKSAASFVTKLRKVRGIKQREYLAVKDCIETMGDTVDRLALSVREIGHLGPAGGEDFRWHMSNVQTWVSAALTNENTCLDGFSGRRMDGNVKVAIKHRITIVAQVTSNALALVNHFASGHRATGSAEIP